MSISKKLLSNETNSYAHLFLMQHNELCKAHDKKKVKVKNLSQGNDNNLDNKIDQKYEEKQKQCESILGKASLNESFANFQGCKEKY